jgi:tetratricopeptide (TPR) repeat protein
LSCPVHRRLSIVGFAAALAIAVPGALLPAVAETVPSASQSATLADALRAARTAVEENPGDAKAHFQLAELLHKFGRDREAGQEYLEATTINREFYVAYHQLAQVCEDQELLRQACQQLEESREARPKELMLRVALSEVLEKQQNYYQAAKALIELVYANAVADRFRPRVNARIHYLLGRAKEAQMAANESVPTDEELDLVPVPLPDPSLRKGLTASKINDSKNLKGIGHVPLQP